MKYMKIMYGHNYNGFKIHLVPMGILSEKQAISNHSQTLECLNSRGGIDVIEAIALVDQTPLNFYKEYTDAEIEEYSIRLSKIANEYVENNP